jgi:hypothetical protein
MFAVKDYLCKAKKRSMEQLLHYCAHIWIVPIKLNHFLLRSHSGLVALRVSHSWSWCWLVSSITIFALINLCLVLPAMNQPLRLAICTVSLWHIHFQFTMRLKWLILAMWPRFYTSCISKQVLGFREWTGARVLRGGDWGSGTSSESHMHAGLQSFSAEL